MASGGTRRHNSAPRRRKPSRRSPEKLPRRPQRRLKRPQEASKRPPRAPQEAAQKLGDGRTARHARAAAEQVTPSSAQTFHILTLFPQRRLPVRIGCAAPTLPASTRGRASLLCRAGSCARLLAETQPSTARMLNPGTELGTERRSIPSWSTLCTWPSSAAGSSRISRTAEICKTRTRNRCCTSSGLEALLRSLPDRGVSIFRRGTPCTRRL